MKEETMASPSEVIQTLLKIGVAARDAFIDAQAHRAVDWDTFLASEDFERIRDGLQRLLDSLDDASIEGAIAAIDEKRRAILGPRSIADLSADELTQYSGLLNARSLLVDQYIRERTHWKTFLTWLSKEALPVLIPIAKTVVSLLT